MQWFIDLIRPFWEFAPNVFLALVILVGGWLLAMLLASIIRKALMRTSVDNKIAVWLAGEDSDKHVEIEQWVSRSIFYLLMLFVIVGFFEALKFEIITEPVERFLVKVFDFAPQILGAAVLILLAWFIATGLRLIIHRILNSMNIDEKVGDTADPDKHKSIPLAKSVSEAVYWLIFLLFLPAILSTLDLQGLLSPVDEMVKKIVGFLPNILTALILFALGWFLARIVRRIITNLLSAAGSDKLSERVGLSNVLGEEGLSGLIGLVVYILILVPVLIMSLDALKLDSITTPARNMLTQIMEALPVIFAAVLVLSIAYMMAKIIANLLATFLAGIGFNNILVKLGLTDEEPDEEPDEKQSPAIVTGHIVFAAIILYAIMQASELLGFNKLADLVEQFMLFASHVVIGLVIFAIGLYLGNLASRAIKAGKTAHADFLALAARLAIVILAGAMALREMGLAEDIINMTFGLLLGAIAVAFALAAGISFGIGGKDMAAKQIDGWIESLQGGKKGGSKKK